MVMMTNFCEEYY